MIIFVSLNGTAVSIVERLELEGDAYLWILFGTGGFSLRVDLLYLGGLKQFYSWTEETKQCLFKGGII